MFFLDWLVFYLAIMFCMCVDNIFWIPTSPEWDKIKSNKFPVKVEGKEYYSRKDYVFRYRILSVLIQWRDIVPGIITSLILTWLRVLIG